MREKDKVKKRGEKGLNERQREPGRRNAREIEEEKDETIESKRNV